MVVNGGEAGADLTVFGPLYARPGRRAVPVTWHIRSCARCAVRWRGDARSTCWNCREPPRPVGVEMRLPPELGDMVRLEELLRAVYGAYEWQQNL